ncbi:MAG: hypothetical protein IPM16_16810 [Chloroflexi bacterium]|nr:hypothetical protein [Chloroflexota bacterium]
MKRLNLTLVCVLLLMLGVSAPTRAAASFAVDTENDTIDDNPGDSLCEDASGDCSLRAAIMEGNALGGDILITIPGGYQITMTTGTAGNPDPASGDFDLYNGAFSIIGSDPAPLIQGNFFVQDRIFEVWASGSLSLSNLSLALGGGDVLQVQYGGAIATAGPFKGDRLRIANNSARSFGGAIYAADTSFELTNSVVINNSARSNGAIYLANVTGQIANTQIIHNTTDWISATFSAPLGVLGVFQVDPGASDVKIVHSTISENFAVQQNGGLWTYRESQATPLVTITNSIMAGNDVQAGNGLDCVSSHAGSVAWQGVNLVGSGNGGCLSGAGGAVIFGTPNHTNPPNITTSLFGGTLPTISLLPGSPGIGQADCSASGGWTTDILSQARPLGSLCDIGAIETPVGQDASLDLSHTAIQHGESLTITVTDPDRAGAGPVVVVMDITNTSNPYSANLFLNEGAPGVFSASFPVAPLPVIPGNGIIEVSPGHVISITYTDVLDGEALQPVHNKSADVIQTPAANLLVNGDFEAGSTGWTITSLGKDKVKDKNPYDGANAFRFKGFAGKLNAKLSQTLLSPAIADGDTITLSAQINSGPTANGKMKFKLKTDLNRQIKADIKFDLSGAYALHELMLPIALLSGETVTEVNVTFADKSQSGKAYVDAVSLTVTPPIVLRGDGQSAGRTATEPGVLPPPASPGGFRGQN